MGVASRKRDPEPYQDNPDLHALWRWGVGIGALLDSYERRNENDWMIFRPDELAHNAMMQFCDKYPEIISEINGCLNRVEKQYIESSKDAYASYISATKELVTTMKALSQQIQEAVAAIAKSDAKLKGKDG